VFDGLSQLGQVEERHGREHVVLDVILHVPVEERRQPRAGERAAAEPVIGHVRRHAVMLGKTAEKTEPAAVLRAEVEDENQEPMPGRDKDCRQQACPISVKRAQLRCSRRSFSLVSGSTNSNHSLSRRPVARR
jgi:hypothetical protein